MTSGQIGVIILLILVLIPTLILGFGMLIMPMINKDHIDNWLDDHGDEL